MNLLRAGLIVLVSGAGLFAASMTAGLLAIVPDSPDELPEPPDHMAPIVPQVGRGPPVFGALSKTGIGLFIAGLLVFIAGVAVKRRK